MLKEFIYQLDYLQDPQEFYLEEATSYIQYNILLEGGEK